MGTSPTQMGYEHMYADDAADEIVSMIRTALKATALLLGGAVIIRLIRKLKQ